MYLRRYPFHLRPKNKQSFQYLRMAVDIVHDMELDQEPDLDLFSMAPDQRARKLDNLRALLGCFYSMSTYVSPHRTDPSIPFQLLLISLPLPLSFPSW